VFQNVCTTAGKDHFEEAVGNPHEANSDNDILHRTETLVPGVLPKGSRYNQLHSINAFSEFEKGKLRFSPSGATVDFWMHMNNLTYHSESKGVSKFERYHPSRLPHSVNSTDITL
jgi:hypothetical protein